MAGFAEPRIEGYSPNMFRVSLKEEMAPVLRNCGLSEEFKIDAVVQILSYCLNKKIVGCFVPNLGQISHALEAVDTVCVTESDDTRRRVQLCFYKTLVEKQSRLEFVDGVTDDEPVVLSSRPAVQLSFLLAGERYQDSWELVQELFAKQEEENAPLKPYAKQLIQSYLLSLTKLEDLSDFKIFHEILSVVKRDTSLNASEKEQVISILLQAFSFMQKRVLKGSESRVERSLQRYMKVYHAYTRSAQNKRMGKTHKDLHIVEAKKLFRKMTYPELQDSESLPFDVSPDLTKLYRRAPHVIVDNGIPVPEMDLEDFRPVQTLPIEPLEEPPLVDVETYFGNRIPASFFRFVRQNPSCVEAFVGSVKEMRAFYEKHLPGYEFRGSVDHGQNSFVFHLYCSKIDPDDFKVVVSGIPSKSNLVHLARFLQASGLDIDKIKYRGSFERLAKSEIAYLDKFAESWPMVPEVVFVGSDFLSKEKSIRGRRATFEIGSKLKGFKTSKFPTSTLEMNTKTFFKGSYKLVRSSNDQERPFAVMSFTMPNGELSYDLVQFLLRKGVRKIVLVGAGGAIPLSGETESLVGKYQMVKRSSKNGYTQELSDRYILDLQGVSDFILEPKKSHATVSSVLDEDQSWLERCQFTGEGSVDVEGFHILKAINHHISEQPDTEIKVLPGVFISDMVVGDSDEGEEETIAHKISGENAFGQLGVLLADVLDQIDLEREGAGKGIDEDENQELNQPDVVQGANLEEGANEPQNIEGS